MSNVQQIYDLTVSLYTFLNENGHKKEDRDQLIEEVEKVLAERKALLSQMKPPYSEDDRKLGAEIAVYDEKIQILFKETLNGIQKDMNLLKQKKVQSKKYENPYSASSTDGVFFDKRN